MRNVHGVLARASEDVRAVIHAAAADLTGEPYPLKPDHPELVKVRTRHYQACIRVVRHVGGALRDWILEARAQHVAWAEIGSVLGISGEAARHRFERHQLITSAAAQEFQIEPDGGPRLRAVVAKSRSEIG